MKSCAISLQIIKIIFATFVYLETAPGLTVGQIKCPSSTEFKKALFKICLPELCPQNFTFPLEASLLSQMFIFRTISQPRTLSADIPAARRGLFTNYDPQKMKTSETPRHFQDTSISFSRLKKASVGEWDWNILYKYRLQWGWNISVYKKYLLKNWNILYNPRHGRIRLQCPLLVVFDILALSKDCNNDHIVNIVPRKITNANAYTWLRQCRSKGRGRGGPCPPSFFPRK